MKSHLLVPPKYSKYPQCSACIYLEGKHCPVSLCFTYLREGTDVCSKSLACTLGLWAIA